MIVGITRCLPIYIYIYVFLDASAMVDVGATWSNDGCCRCVRRHPPLSTLPLMTHIYHPGMWIEQQEHECGQPPLKLVKLIALPEECICH